MPGLPTHYDNLSLYIKLKPNLTFIADQLIIARLGREIPMGKRPSNFRQRDLRAAAIAARQAGVSIARIEVGRDGVIKIIAGKLESPDKEPNDRNEWDEAV
jgi:hypothetical protein